MPNKDTGRPRSTSFGYELSEIEPTKLIPRIDPAAVTTPQQELRLIVSMIGLHHAD